MEQNNSDKSTFRVKFLGEYHDIVIDWNDDKHKYYKRQLLFDQLELITGIPAKYTAYVLVSGTQPHEDLGSWGHGRLFYNTTFRNQFLDDGRWDKPIICHCMSSEPNHLSFNYYGYYGEAKNLGIYYNIWSSLVPEGVCSAYECQYKNTKTFFSKLKNIINNEELNAKLAMARKGAYGVFNEDEFHREFNILQYLNPRCDFDYRRESISYERNIYLRTHG